MHVVHDKRWILAAIPDATITVVRLRGSDATLMERLDRREIGVGREAQISRSLRQAIRMGGEDALDFLVVDTDDARRRRSRARFLTGSAGLRRRRPEQARHLRLNGVAWDAVAAAGPLC